MLFGELLQTQWLTLLTNCSAARLRRKGCNGMRRWKQPKKKLKGRILKNKTRISDLKKKKTQAIVYPWNKYTILATQEDVSISDYNRMPICK